VRDVVSGRESFFLHQRPASAPITQVMPVARLGLARPLGSLVTAKANLGHYGRAPSFLELYGNTGSLLGNPLLLPETGWNGDLGVEYRGGGPAAWWRGRSTVFGARADDLIEWVPISQTQARVENVGRARIWGVEQDLGFETARFVAVTAQATYLDARDTSEVAAHRGHLLPQRPRWHGYLRPQLRHLPLGRGLEAGVYLEGDLGAGAYYDPANLVPLPRRLLLGAGLEVGAPRAGLRLVASAKNLTDSRALEVVKFPPPGRSIFVSLNWSHESIKE